MNVPPSPRQRSSWVRWLLVGAGGCLVVIVLALVGFAGCLAALSGGGGDQGSDEPSPQQLREQAVPVGETVQAGNVSWKAVSVQQAIQLKSFGQRKRGNFVIVDLTFTNNGNEAVTLDSSSLAIIDGQGRTFETDPDASFYVPTSKDLFLNKVNPGVTTQGRAIFEVAPDAEQLILRAGDTDVFSDKNAYINLGV